MQILAFTVVLLKMECLYVTQENYKTNRATREPPRDERKKTKGGVLTASYVTKIRLCIKRTHQQEKLVVTSRIIHFLTAVTVKCLVTAAHTITGS